MSSPEAPRPPRSRLRTSLHGALALFGLGAAVAVLGFVSGVSLPEVRPHPHPPREPVAVANWQELRSGGQSAGPQHARMTVVVFSDFQCPSCARMAATLAALREAHPDVRVVFRHFPLTSIHPLARQLAEASECAARQGRFTEFHDVAFATLGSPELVTIDEMAAQAGVRDVHAFSTCLRDPATASRVQADLALGNALGITGTPTLLVDGMLYFVTPDARDLSRLAGGR